MGWIHLLYLQYNNPILFVPKKGDELQMCIAFCALNQTMIIDCYLIPRINNILDQLVGVTGYGKINLIQPYH